MKNFETFEHEADIGIRGYGKTLEEAFSNILKALAEVIVEELPEEGIKKEKYVEIEIKREELVELLVEFVNKVISYFYIEKIIFWEFEGCVEFCQKCFSLKGKIWGEEFVIEKFGYGVEVKGATFTMAKVEKKDGYWIVQCVIDV